jgi:uncharacterized protein
MLCGRTREKNLDHPDFLPIFDTAARLGVPLFMHPQIPQRAVREVYYSGFSDLIDTAFATFALGWHYEAGIQFVRLILAGIFDKYPDLQIILGHWGEVVLFYLERLTSLGRVAHLQRPIADYIRQNLYVTPSGMWSQPYLQRMLELVGPNAFCSPRITPTSTARADRVDPSLKKQLSLWSRRNCLLTGTGTR